jgi:D-alanine transaminase
LNYVLLNHSIIKREDSKVDIEDRGYQFGDGIYEVIRVYQGQPYTLKEHLERLERSATELSLSLPYSLEELQLKLNELIDKNKVQEGNIYLQVTRGVAPRLHTFPSSDVQVQLIAYTKKVERPVSQHKEGVPVILTEDIRWLRCDIKSINLLGNVLARQKAAEQGCYEAILHRGDTITEGSLSNAFMIKNGTLYTHPATNMILNGITRQKVLILCQKLGIPIKEENYHINDLLSADEIFITNTNSEVMPVIRVDKKKIGPGTPGPLTLQLQEAYTDDVVTCLGISL